MDELIRDLRHATRTLWRAPGFAIVVLLTLALGIGFNTALFSVVKAVILAPLPYREPESVAMIWSRWSNFKDRTWVSVAEFQNYQRELHSFSDIALFDQGEAAVTEGQEPEKVMTAPVTTNFFRVVGVDAALGRTLTEQDGVEGHDKVAILANGLWRRRYAGDPRAIGKTILLDGEAFTIVGVLPDGFKLPLDYKQAGSTQVYVPLVLPPFSDVPNNGGSHGNYAIGRLAPGATVARANKELSALVARLAQKGVYPKRMDFSAFAISASDEVAGAMKRPLLLLLGAVGLVLLIACANVANLLLVRAEDRRREVSVRAALGAERSRLIRQFMVENSVLALVGGSAGVLFAAGGVLALKALAPPSLPRISEVTIDVRVLAFTLVLSLLTALLFGLVPAIHGSRVDLQETLKEGGRANTGSRERSRFRSAVVAGEVALAVVLVIGAGLMLRSFRNLLDVNPGFRADHVLTMRMDAPQALYANEKVEPFYDDVLRTIRALPGVKTAGMVRVLPIDDEIGDAGIQVEGYTSPTGGNYTGADWEAASDGYFESLGIPVVQGRTFTPADRYESEQVIIVNESFAKKYWPDGRWLNRRLRFGPDTIAWQRVVGIVADVKQHGLLKESKVAFYRPQAQWRVSRNGRPVRNMTLVIRTAVDPKSLAATARRAIMAIDQRLPLSSVKTMDEVVGSSFAQPLFTLLLLGVLGALALTLALIGIYGVVSYTVAQRRQEMGIRMALGAQPRALVMLALRQGLVPVATGVIAGICIALVATRVMSALLIDTASTDLTTYVAVALLAVGATSFASWVPARRAARVNPLEALRSE
jgi:putative ABC transport system permease protein